MLACSHCLGKDGRRVLTVLVVSPVAHAMIADESGSRMGADLSRPLVLTTEGFSVLARRHLGGRSAIVWQRVVD